MNAADRQDPQAARSAARPCRRPWAAPPVRRSSRARASVPARLRAACGFAVARSSDPEALRYLNALCVRALHICRSRRRARRKSDIFTSRFPATLAATAWLQGFSAILMLAGALRRDYRRAESGQHLCRDFAAMYPADDLERLVTSARHRADFLRRKPVAFGIKSVFSASLFVHNTGIGFASFATGILAGIPTIILVFYNGITLGAFAWIFSRDAAWPISGRGCCRMRSRNCLR